MSQYSSLFYLSSPAMSQGSQPACCYSNTPETSPAEPDDSAMPIPTSSGTMFQEILSCTPYAASAPVPADDKAVEHMSTDNTADPSKEGLDKFCAELGYRNLTFLHAMCSPSGHSGFDNTDGCFNGAGFRIIKTTIVLLLQHIIDGKLKDECEGCATDHPSQLQHSCLFEPAPYYFDSRFEELSRKLFKPDLQTIIDFTLRRCGLMTNNVLRIQGAAAAILQELRDEPFREKLLDKTYKKAIYDAVDLWQSSPTPPGL